MYSKALLGVFLAWLCKKARAANKLSRLVVLVGNRQVTPASSWGQGYSTVIRDLPQYSKFRRHGIVVQNSHRHCRLCSAISYSREGHCSPATLPCRWTGLARVSHSTVTLWSGRRFVARFSWMHASAGNLEALSSYILPLAAR